MHVSWQQGPLALAPRERRAAGRAPQGGHWQSRLHVVARQVPLLRMALDEQSPCEVRGQKQQHWRFQNRNPRLLLPASPQAYSLDVGWSQKA
jgi:hypothetical protein